MDLKTFIEVLWRRKVLALACLLCTVGTAVVGSLFLPRYYEASVRIGMGSGQGASAAMEGISLRGAAAMNAPSENELARRTSRAGVRPLLEQVIWKLQIRNADGRLADPVRFKALSSLSGRTSVRIQQQSDSDAIKIRARARDPEEAAMTANTLAKLFLEHNRQERQEEYRLAKVFLEGEIADVKADYVEALKDIRNFRLNERAIDLPLETQASIAHMDALLTEKENIATALAETRAREAELNRQLEADALKLAVPGSVVGDNRTYLGELKTMLVDTENNLAAAKVEKRSGHPDVQALEQRMANLREQIRGETESRLEAAPELRDLQRQQAAQEAQWEEVNRQIEAHAESMSKIPLKTFVGDQLALRYTVAESLYNALLQSLHEVGLAESMVLSDMRIIEPATPPPWNRPEGPKRLLVAILGVLFGLGFALAAVFTIEHFDDTIRTLDEAKTISGLPLLGVIPYFGRKRDRLIWTRPPTDSACEAYRSLFMSLNFREIRRDLRRLIVTSPLASEGKTTTVANLGITAARDGKRVLLVDGDLRKPKLGGLFGLQAEKGLADWMLDAVSVDAAVHATRQEGLFVMPSGSRAADPGRIIASLRTHAGLHAFMDRYDLVIFDSPPVLAVHDAILIMGFTDAILSVFECRRETRGALTREKALLAQAGYRPLGLVANKFRNTLVGYDRYDAYYAQGTYGSAAD